MKLISLLLTIWFFYVVYTILIKPLILSLLMWWQRRAPGRQANKNTASYRRHRYNYDTTKVVDAEFEEIE